MYIPNQKIVSGKIGATEIFFILLSLVDWEVVLASPDIDILPPLYISRNCLFRCPHSASRQHTWGYWPFCQTFTAFIQTLPYCFETKLKFLHI